MAIQYEEDEQVDRDEEGVEVVRARAVPYDTLVIAVGSQSNDFGTPGVAEHALRLETVADPATLVRLTGGDPEPPLRAPGPLEDRRVARRSDRRGSFCRRLRCG